MSSYMPRLIVVIAAAALSSAVATNEALSMGSSSMASLAGMRRYFVRSDEEHSNAMDSISRRMNASDALQMLEEHQQATPVLVQLARRAVSARAVQKKTFLRTDPRKVVVGFGGFQPALDLLNSMLYESMKKYDTETAKCTDYYSKQCGMLNGIRGEIASSNFQSASCREHTLGSQGQISLLEADIPEMKQQLKDHGEKCSHEVHELRERLKIVLGDIAVMTKILEMTECKSPAMLQVDLLHCHSKCSKEKFVALDHTDLQTHLTSLKSSVAIGLVQDTFKQLASASTDGEEAAEDEEEDDTTPSNGTSNKTQKLEKVPAPVPRTEVPDSPCDDPYAGAPNPTDKRAAKCTVSGSPDCDKIQERFLLIQSGIQDEKEDLQQEIAKVEKECEGTKTNINTQLIDTDRSLKDEQTKLADAMMCEATAAEQGRLGNKEHGDATDDLKAMMKTCSTNSQNFETEICGLKKIRGELYKMRGTGKPTNFQDCTLSPWEEQECSVPCGGGIQKLTRSVVSPPQGGAKCLPLQQMKSCSDSPCPVDCRLESWSGWSKCSAECGGGVEQRLRDVSRHMKNNGKPCGETSETKACNVQACEADCDLSDWSEWSKCSKECDGGTRKRQKFVKKQALGQGTCAGLWDDARLAYSDCNRHACKLPASSLTLKCKAELDVVLVIDGSGSLTKEGWAASKKAAETFVAAFEGTESKARLSVILFSGPTSWTGVKKCLGDGTMPVDLKATCKVNVVEHFSKDIAEVKSKVAALEWPKGSTLTSLALAAAKSELNLGRKNAQSVVVVITEGRPMSYRKTNLAARDLRKSARLVWVPVTQFAPLAKIREWATRRWQENVIPIKDFDELAKPAAVSRMISDICPQVSGN
jgi:hypothetical protein